jgi:hypothetical protein
VSADSFSTETTAAAPAVPPRVLAPAAAANGPGAFNIPQRSQLDLKGPASQQRPSSTAMPLTPAGPFSPAPSALRVDDLAPHANPFDLAGSGGELSGGLSSSRLSSLAAEACALVDSGVEAVGGGRWALVSGFPPGDPHAPVLALQHFGQVGAARPTPPSASHPPPSCLTCLPACLPASFPR